MSSGIASLHKVLKDENRRKIILLLQEKGSLSYVDLMKILGITNTGKMNYHLKILGELLSKKEDGQYFLSERGLLASRLLLEFPESNTSQLGLSPKGPQILWCGIIICIFTLMGLFILFRFMYNEIASGYVYGLDSSVPLIFACILFLFVGSYMIISDVRKNSKTNRKLSNLTKRVLVASTVFIIILGIALVGVVITLPVYVEHLDQIGYEENPGVSYTVHLNAGSVYRLDMVVANTTKLDQTVNLTITHLEENQTWTLIGRKVEEQTIEAYAPVDATGHYEIDLHGFNVTQITTYIRTGVSPSMSRLTFWATSVSTLITGTLSFFGYGLYELFQGRKTGVFWWGLIVLSLALSWLFGLLWYGVVPEASVYIIFSRLGSPISIARISASIILMLFGFYMMKKGVKKESWISGSTTGLKKSKLDFYLSRRNYRALVYLFASVVINLVSLVLGYFHFSTFLFYINWVGTLLLFPLYGRPHMYGGWYDPNSILPYVLLMFGLFVEIFIVCEFFISMNKRAYRIKKPEKSQNPP